MVKDFLVIGIANHILAIDKSTGKEIWRTKLPEVMLSNIPLDPFAEAALPKISLHVVEDKIYAGYYGRLYCLEARTGKILWKNNLKGLGNGFVTLASVRESEAES